METDNIHNVHEVFKEFFSDCRMLIIGGPCVLEDIDTALEVGAVMKEICKKYGLLYCFKASFDKANRTSIKSYRGPGLKKGLEMLKVIKTTLNVPLISDIHEPYQAEAVRGVLDCIQIPAFLSRQTDLLISSGRTMLPVNIKKGQFLAPWDVQHSIEKVRSTGNSLIMVTERGSQFGYNNLVVDMRSISIMASFGAKVIFDATHSVQLPGGGSGCSGGQREFAPPLARAAVAAGADGVFMEVHPDPENALCDGPNSLYLRDVEQVIKDMTEIYKIVRHK